MQIKTVFTTQFRNPAFRCGLFPGALRLPDGSLLVLFVAGDAFESSDQHIEQARSFDNGRTWQLEGPLYDHSRLPFDIPFSDCAKPALLADGTLMALGYGFLRDRPDMDLSSYAEKFGHFPQVRNFLLFSSDQGKSWSRPAFLAHSYPGLETSGPPLKLDNGEVLFFGPPFGTRPGEQVGLCFAGTPRGSEFRQISTFWEKGDIAPWEVRSCQLESGRIMLIIWAYDLKKQQHLNNHIVYSDDRGRSWSAPIDLGLPGQAANLLPLNQGEFLVIQTRREGSECGLFLSRFQLDVSGKPTFLEGDFLMRAGDLASAQGNIEKQFSSLKFGQPSMIPLGKSEYLVIYWQTSGEISQIQVRGIQLDMA